MGGGTLGTKMDINEPDISRKLAILIQHIEFEHRKNFLDKAAEAPDLRTFLESIVRARGAKRL